MKKAFFLTVAAIVFGLSATPAFAGSRTSATIVSVGDGDTIRVREGNKTITVRLACADAPEMAQSPYGQQSSARLKQLLPIGTGVQLRTITTDKYGRRVAEVYLGERSINLTMVAEGQAVAYRQYLSGCDRNQFLNAEANARKGRLAFWSQPHPIMPWDFRKSGQRATLNPFVKPGLNRRKVPFQPA